MLQEPHVRRVRKRYDGPVCLDCPETKCLLCRTMGRISDTAMTFVTERSEKMPVALGDTVDPSAFEDGALSFVADGTVIVQRLMNDGRRFVSNFIYPGEPLSICRGGQDITAIAATTAMVCVLSPDLVSTLTRAYPQVAVQLSNMALEDRDRGMEHMTILARADVPERMAYLLHRLAAGCGRVVDDGIAIDLPMTRTDIADYLGLNTETVSRQFSKLKKLGLIKLPKPDRLIVPDLESLKSMLPIGGQPAQGTA